MKVPWLACLLGCTVLGCESTGVGNPRSELTVSVTSDLNNAEPDAPDPTVVLDSTHLHDAVIVFGKMHWLPCDAADQPSVLPGPFVVNLITSQVEPNLPPIAVPPGGYCGFDAPLSTHASDAAMQGRSILFSGVRSDGTLFILYTGMQGTLHMRPEPGVVWTLSNAGDMLWALRPHRWLSLDELDNETSDAFGSSRRVVVVDVDRHPLLYEYVRERIGARSSLHEDLNHNGKVDDDERSGAALLGVGLPSLD